MSTNIFQDFFNRSQCVKSGGLTPLGDFAFNRYDGSNLLSLSNITTSEITFHTRFAWKDKYIAGEFDRLSAGSKYPVIQLDVNC
jgi:hypothetical protein